MTPRRQCAKCPWKVSTNRRARAKALRKAAGRIEHLMVARQLGEYTIEEHKELYRLIGYSLCGFDDAFPSHEEDEANEQV